MRSVQVLWSRIRARSLQWKVFLLLALIVSFAGAQSGNNPGATAAEVGKAAASVQASNGSQPGQPTAPTPATAQKIAALPEPFPPGLIRGIDIDGQSRDILNHLGEIVRYYRMAVVPIQKVGEPSDVLYSQQAENEA